MMTSKATNPLWLSALHAAYVRRDKSVEDLATQFGVSRRTVSNIAKREGWNLRESGRQIGALQFEKVKPLWEAGLRAEDIGKILGKSRSSVLSCAKRGGLGRPEGWKPRLTLREWCEEQIAARWAKEVRQSEARKKAA